MFYHFREAFLHVQSKRFCINPNEGFVDQLKVVNIYLFYCTSNTMVYTLLLNYSNYTIQQLTYYFNTYTSEKDEKNNYRNLSILL